MVFAVLFGIVLFVLVGALVRSQGDSLAQKFASLKDVKGMNIHDIIAVVGSPQAESNLANGTRIFQWHATGFHIALLFAGDVCLGITHQSRT